MKKVKVNKLPAGYHMMPDGTIMRDADHMAHGGQTFRAFGGKAPSKQFNKSLNAVPRHQANVEAEKGETVITDLDRNGIPENYNINGNKHSEGGTPLSLGKSFIFSDHKSMALNKRDLKDFIDNTKKTKMTPAQVSKLKKFDMSGDNEVLADPNSDRLARATAERNIQNKLTQLGKLALYQEGKKSFEDGVPDIALPYLATQGVSAESIQQLNAQVQGPQKRFAQQGLEKREDGLYYGNVKLDGDYFGNRDGKVSAKELAYYNDVVLPRLDETLARDLQPGESASATIPGMPGSFWRRGTGPVTYTRTMGSLPAPRVVKEGTTTTRTTNSYGDLQEIFADPKYDQLKKVAYERYKQQHPDTPMSQEAFWNNFMTAQDQIYQIQQKRKDDPTWDATSEDWDNYGGLGVKGKNRKYHAWAKEAGVTPLSEDDTKAFQEGYYILGQLQQTPEFSSILKGWDLTPKGVKDADGNLLDRPISEYETGIFGNTTSGQQIIVNDQTTTPPETVQDPAEPTDDLTRTPGTPPTGFWGQDMMNLMANEGRRNIREFPYFQRVNPYLPDVLFEDPERQLQANQETANTMIRNLSMTGDEASAAANAGYLQGNLAAKQADVEAAKANRNVDIWNDNQKYVGEVMNNAALYNDAMAADYRKGVAIVNQSDNNFREAKKADRYRLLNDAFTNRADTMRLNDLYDYKVVPELWGEGYFQPGSGRIGQTPVEDMLGTSAGASDTSIEARRRQYKESFPNLTDNEIDKQLMKDFTGTSYDPTDPQDVRNRGYNRQYKSGGSVDPFSVLRKFIK